MNDTPLKIAMVAGEVSGDRQGAALLTALRERIVPRPVVAWGIGGDLMREAGVRLRLHSGLWATIGIAATLGYIPRLLTALADMKRALRQDPPDVLVLIDAGAFNARLARWAKRSKICPVFYYFPPGSWRKIARGAGKSNLAEATDRIVTPFPWSAEHLQNSGADAHFVGHPSLDLVKSELDDETFYNRFGLDPYRPLIALLPGSRKIEIQYILPALIGAADQIARRIPGVQFAVALARGTPRAQVEEIIRREQRRGGRLELLMHQAQDKLAQIAQTALPTPLPRLATNEGVTLDGTALTDEEMPVKRAPAAPTHAPLVICEGLTYDVMARSDLVITKSGTSTLEAAILQKPMIIVYRVSPLMTLEWRARRRSLSIAHIGLPNILADERLFPELLQDEATPEAISELAVEILVQPERLLHLKERLAAVVRDTLGEPGGVRRAADLLYETATAHERSH